MLLGLAFFAVASASSSCLAHKACSPTFSYLVPWLLAFAAVPWTVACLAGASSLRETALSYLGALPLFVACLLWLGFSVLIGAALLVVPAYLALYWGAFLPLAG